MHRIGKVCEKLAGLPVIGLIVPNQYTLTAFIGDICIKSKVFTGYSKALEGMVDTLFEGNGRYTEIEIIGPNW